MGGMVVRDLLIRDLVELEDKALFPLENLTNKPKLVQKVFEDDKGLIGAVIVCGTVELNLVFADRSARDKIGMMKQMTDILYNELHSRGYCDIRMTTVDPKFADLVVKHFDFKYAIGHSLFRRY